MERLYDELLLSKERAALDDAAWGKAQELEAYYTGGQWLADYQRDESGGWPPDLKRGVLSQDGLFDLLSELDARRRRISGTEEI